MVYGAINRHGEPWYTKMSRVFEAINNCQKEYNWLISDVDCVPSKVRELCAVTGYTWLTGEELTQLVKSDDGQWVWAVLSGFDKSIPLSEILQYPLPQAIDYAGFWETPLSLQHPFASVEIVPWDSSATLLFSSDKKLVRDFREFFPLSEDLAEHCI